MKATVKGICIGPEAGKSMVRVKEVRAIAGSGLEGDRYATGNGSFNKGKRGVRQVTLMNAIFFKRSGFRFTDSRRNIFVEGVELNDLIDKTFTVGEALFRGVKYCDPCERPKKLSHKRKSFKKAFFDRGGIVAEIITDGTIKVGDPVIPPPKGY